MIFSAHPNVPDTIYILSNQCTSCGRYARFTRLVRKWAKDNGARILERRIDINKEYKERYDQLKVEAGLSEDSLDPIVFYPDQTVKQLSKVE